MLKVEIIEFSFFIFAILVPSIQLLRNRRYEELLAKYSKVDCRISESEEELV